ncbi:hypothetical protein Tco_0952814 [Tanacetum coccineum]|uniref:Reverse transcriptase domain-containing protein n=1 Tax=Tanacetum coccineum TaxID=301880 RepID=A0ABQ5E3H4_9ASTR
MDIRMSQLEKVISEKNVTTPATIKAVEEVCVTCGANHNFNNYPLTRNKFPVFHDNIHQFQQTAAVGNFVQRNPPNLANQMRPPGFNQPNVQNNQGNQNRYQGNNFNSNQNREGNFNQNRQNNQGAVYQAPPYQPPMNQLPVYQAPTQQIQGVSKTDFENYVKVNDAVLKNVQNQGQNLQNQMANLQVLLISSLHNIQNSASTSNSGTLLSQTEPEQNPETSMDKVQKPSSESTAQVPPPEEEDSIFIEIPKPKAKKTVNVEIQDLNSFSNSQSRVTIKTLMIIIFYKILKVLLNKIFVVQIAGGPHATFQCQPMNEEYYEQNSCYDSNSFGFDQFQLPQCTVNHPILNAQNEFLNSQNKLMEQMTSICDMDGQIMQKKEEERRIVEEQAAKEDMSIKEMRHEQQKVDYEIKEITNDLDFNEWGSEVRKKEQAYNEEQYSAARRRMLSIPFVDEDDYIPLGDIIARYTMSKAITPDLPIEEPDNSLSMGDKHLDTTLSIKNLVPIPSEFEGISDDTSDVPNCDNNHINVESNLVEYLSNHDTSIKIDPILEEFVGELAHIAPIPPRIVEAILIQMMILRVMTILLRTLNNPTPDRVFKSPSSFPIPVVDSDSFFEETDTSLSHLDNSLPEFETFSDHTEETRSGSITTYANYSLPENDSFLFEIEPDQGGLTSVVISDNSNDLLLEIPEFESFHFDPLFPRPPPEPPNVEISLVIKTDVPEINDFDEHNGDECFDQRGGEINFEANDSFTFFTWTFLPFLTYLEVSPLLSSTKNEDTIFDPDIFT